MSIAVLKAGLQTTLQGAARTGLRHFGVPSAGPADPLSMSLANRLVGAPADQTALEITMNGCRLVFTQPIKFALTGAEARVTLAGAPVRFHVTTEANTGDELVIGPAENGCRTYLAVSGTIKSDSFLDSVSTYLPGGFGGFGGGALKDEDELCLSDVYMPDSIETPRELRPLFNDRFIVQVVPGADFDDVPDLSLDRLFSGEFTATQRTSRMGVEVSGARLSPGGKQNKSSSAVFAGSIQLPPDGKPFLLLSDAQTTGGYPHILQVIRGDRFQLGQMRPGSVVSFVRRTPDEANRRFRARWAAYQDWLKVPVM